MFGSTLWALSYIQNSGVDSTFCYSTAIYKDYGFCGSKGNYFGPVEMSLIEFTEGICSFKL